MAIYPKRRIVEQLPAVNQTTVLKNFFSATIDHLFQNGDSEKISGYIGQKPSYYDSTKDFYLSEPSTEREQYQLEPMMLSYGSDGSITDKLTYVDLINYLKFNGSNVTDPNNLFSNEYYSWGPPIDLDMINNYTQYLWMGGLTDDEAELVTINLKAPRQVYSYDGNPNTIYALPPALTIYTSTTESPAVLVNGTPVDFSIVNGAVTLIDSPNVGDVIETIRYGNLENQITGQAEFYFYPLIKWEASYSGLNTSGIYKASIPRSYSVGELVYVGDNFGNGDVYVCITAHTASSTFDDTYWQLTTGGSKATSGSIVRLIDGLTTTKATGRKYILDYSHGKLFLSDDNTRQANGATALYTVIDRTSAERSIWALRNMWIHKSALEWTGQDFIDKKAQRPIICFLASIELYNYGSNRVEDVQAVLTATQADLTDAWDLYPYDYNVWDQDKINLSRINGKLFGQQDGKYIGSVLVDNGYVLQPNDRLLVMQASPNEPELNQYIYRVVSNENVPLPSGASADVIELVLESQPEYGDIVRVVPGLGTPSTQSPFSIFTDVKEYWYNGSEWTPAQNGLSPLFKLFDIDHNALDDTSVFAGSDFTGSKLFSYVVGTGANDQYIGQPIKLDSYNQPIFQIDSVINRVTYNAGEIIGYYYYHFTDTDTYLNNWFKSVDRSVQNLTNGFYEVPLNLQANPINQEIETITRSQWFDHVSQIMSGQVGFTGQPYTVNNWRDTAKDYSLGNTILQHSSPLLKTMLCASNANYDVLEAIKYADAEYTRFKNRFIQKIDEMNDDGIMSPSALPSEWVIEALTQLKINKTIEFPFSLSLVGGDNYFIPPTPATLGLSKITKPEIFVDTTYVSDITMIKGHDGSFTPAYGDYRDNIILALEILIHDNIPQIIRDNGAVVEIDEFISGISSPQGYSISDFNNIVLQLFYKWAGANGLDFYTNSTFDVSDPFTWNYSSSVDYYGNNVTAGNWRGIYRYYFDTDRPHLAPWEMLGFYEKPSYWDNEYGFYPYTSGNTKMWDDIRDGFVRDGTNTILARYVRPDLYKYLPVDDNGFLLNPLDSRVVSVEPTTQNAREDWKYGDQAPIENLWRVSSAFQYAKAYATFLLKPTDFVELGWDTINNVKDDLGQYINKITGNRPLNKNIYVHGEIVNDERIYRCGVQQWISDYMMSKGQDPANFGSAIRGLTVQLGYKMAAFTDPDNLTILADNLGVISSEDIAVSLYTSPQLSKENYSGILIEKVRSGYKLIGYNFYQPWFNVIYGDSAGPKSKISVSNTEVTNYNNWYSGSYYPTNTLVSYNGSIYKCAKNHTAGTAFDQQYWTLVGQVTQSAPSIVNYSIGTNITTVVPYGTIVKTIQEVADIVLGHQRYMLTRGWSFTNSDPDTGAILNFEDSIIDFLNWAQINWADGNFITLSPSSSGLYFNTDFGFVSDVFENHSILDSTGLFINREKLVVNRIEGNIEILSSANDIFGAVLTIHELEHVLIVNNNTVFGDLIYSPLFNLRQPRLKLIGRRSVDWNGRLDAPGFILINDQITSNFTKASDDFRYIYEIEKSDNAEFKKMALHMTGFQNKTYLTDLLVSDVEQFEFYKGAIQQKGAIGNFDKLLRSNFIDQNRDIKFLDEWAFKIDEYGGINNKTTTSFHIERSDIKSNPQVVNFMVANGAVNTDPRWLNIIDTANTTTTDDRWVAKPNDTLNVFFKRDGFSRLPQDLPVSGYVRTDEATYVSIDSGNIAGLWTGNNMLLGETVWIHKADLEKNVTNQNNTRWYVLGTYLGNGTWDSSNLTMTEDTSYITTYNDIGTVFRSKAYDAPFITNGQYFSPIAGRTYSVEFKIRKVSPTTTGVPSYVRPAFDAFDTSGNPIQNLQAVGSKYGFGYVSNPSAADYDLIDTSGWALGQWYTVGASWIAPSNISIGSARGRIRINRDLIPDQAPYSNAIYEMETSIISVQDTKTWDIFKIFNASADGNVNTVSKFVVDNGEDITTTRIYMIRDHGLVDEDIGNYLIVDGNTGTDPDLSGVHQIYGFGSDYIEIYSMDNSGYDFSVSGNSITPPSVRLLKSVHFTDSNSLNIFVNNNRAHLETGTLLYLDGTDTTPWNVYTVTKTVESGDDYDQTDNVYANSTVIDYNTYRIQSKRIDVSGNIKTGIYNSEVTQTGRQIGKDQTVLNSITLNAPLIGKLHKSADKIDFRTSYDPATYSNVGVTTGSFVSVSTDQSGEWTDAYVGKMWWDMNTVRFLETDTDNVIYGLSTEERYKSEINYKMSNFGKIAPGCSVDVYEWVKSDLSPTDYVTAGLKDTTGVYSGEIFSENPNWVEYKGVDSNGYTKTYYYFWVKNRTISPANKGITTIAISNYISNLTGYDVPWFAPILPNSLLISGTSSYLLDSMTGNSSTVFQIETGISDYDGVKHDEWLLLRQNDERSQAPSWMWDKINSSIVGFDNNKQIVPQVVNPPIINNQINGVPVWVTNMTNISNMNESLQSGAAIGDCYDGDSFYGVIQAYDPEGEPIVYSITSGSLPIGLSLNSRTGAITGTVTLDHIGGTHRRGDDYTWTFDISASDGINTRPHTFSITVKHIGVPPVWVTAANLGSSPSLASVSYQLVAVPDNVDNDGTIIDNPPANSITYAKGTVSPNTATFNVSSSGLLTGTIPVVTRSGSTWTIPVTATYDGEAALRNFTVSGIFVNHAPVWVTGSSLGTFNESTAVSIQLSATDSDADALAYSLVGGTLPVGVSLSSTGLLSGTLGSVLADTVYNFTIRVSDPDTHVDRAFTMTVAYTNKPPIWDTASGTIATLYQGNIVNVQLAAHDPDGDTLTYTVDSSSTLPSGVSMTSSGYISGTPNAVGSYSFTINVSDGHGHTVGRGFTIVVNQIPNSAPQWVTSAGQISEVYSQDSYSYQLVATDINNDPLTYTITSGSLLNGLSMSSSGLITGTIPQIIIPPVQIIGYVPAQSSGNLVYDGALSLNGSRWDDSGLYIIGGVGGDTNQYWRINTGAAAIPSTTHAYSDKFVVAPNDNYTFQYTLYSSVVGPSGYLISDIEWFDTNGTSIGSSQTDQFNPADPSYDPSHTTRYVFSGVRWKTVISPANAVYGRFRIYTSSLRGNLGQTDYHFSQFMVSRTNTLQGFSDDATTGGGSYNQQTPIYNTVNPSDYDLSATFTVSVTDGTVAVPRTFSMIAHGIASVTTQFTSNASWTVPAHVRSVMFSWVVGAGGAGGWGTEAGNGGGGGGGGSGGYQHYQEVAVNPGDVFDFTVGRGGISDPGLYTLLSPPTTIVSQQAGGSTIVKLNGNPIISVSGGSGGVSSTNTGATFFSAAGGAGGLPSGGAGATGQVGSSDYASSGGGIGAAGPLTGATGGAAGIARATPYIETVVSGGGSINHAACPVCGQNGVGYGSGGGGGGSYDRPPGIVAGGTWWAGGDGANGLIEIIYPSQGSTGGTAPR